ncbi:unnamed protein product [Gordionus sp. m RMFG-2023]
MLIASIQFLIVVITIIHSKEYYENEDSHTFIIDGIPAEDLNELRKLYRERVKYVLTNYGSYQAQGSYLKHVQNFKGIFEGDIMIDREQYSFFDPPKFKYRTKRNAITGSMDEFMWTSNIINYKIGDSIGSDIDTQILRLALEAWTDYTCLEFRLTKSSDHYIQFEDTNDDTCRSYIGRVGGQQKVYLDFPKCANTGDIIKVVGHALGLLHTHTRTDRDNHLYLHIFNADPQYYEAFSIDRGNLMNIPYDYGSLMHIPQYMFQKKFTKEPTILSSNIYYQTTMGSSHKVSFYDSMSINNLYCKSSCPANDTVCLNSGYPSPKNCKRCLCPTGLTGNKCDKPDTGTVECPENVGLHYLNQSFRHIEISSPNHPQHYTLNQECIWLIKADCENSTNGRLKFMFVKSAPLQLPLSKGGACAHWIEIKYSKDLGLTGARICSSINVPDAIYSEEDTLLLIFDSSSEISNYGGKGFRARVSIGKSKIHNNHINLPTRICGIDVERIPKQNVCDCAPIKDKYQPAPIYPEETYKPPRFHHAKNKDWIKKPKYKHPYYSKITSRPNIKNKNYRIKSRWNNHFEKRHRQTQPHLHLNDENNGFSPIGYRNAYDQLSQNNFDYDYNTNDFRFPYYHPINPYRLSRYPLHFGPYPFYYPHDRASNSMPFYKPSDFRYNPYQPYYFPNMIPLPMYPEISYYNSNGQNNYIHDPSYNAYYSENNRKYDGNPLIDYSNYINTYAFNKVTSANFLQYQSITNPKYTDNYSDLAPFKRQLSTTLSSVGIIPNFELIDFITHDEKKATVTSINSRYYHSPISKNLNKYHNSRVLGFAESQLDGVSNDILYPFYDANNLYNHANTDTVIRNKSNVAKYLTRNNFINLVIDGNTDGPKELRHLFNPNSIALSMPLIYNYNLIKSHKNPPQQMRIDVVAKNLTPINQLAKKYPGFVKSPRLNFSLIPLGYRSTHTNRKAQPLKNSSNDTHIWESWTKWSPCTEPCGGCGFKYRRKKCYSCPKAHL